MSVRHLTNCTRNFVLSKVDETTSKLGHCLNSAAGLYSSCLVTSAGSTLQLTIVADWLLNQITLNYYFFVVINHKCVVFFA